jgi:hypothetical protein
MMHTKVQGSGRKNSAEEGEEKMTGEELDRPVSPVRDPAFGPLRQITAQTEMVQNQATARLFIKSHFVIHIRIINIFLHKQLHRGFRQDLVFGSAFITGDDIPFMEIIFDRNEFQTDFTTPEPLPTFMIFIVFAHCRLLSAMDFRTYPKFALSRNMPAVA